MQAVDGKQEIYLEWPYWDPRLSGVQTGNAAPSSTPVRRDYVATGCTYAQPSGGSVQPKV